jgi:hypothetical protein
MAETHSNEIARLWQTAVQHYNDDRLMSAETVRRQILSQQPDSADALHLLGVVAHHLGHSQEAIGTNKRDRSNIG